MAKKEKLIISLGGSLIYPDKIDTNYLNKFKKLIVSNLSRFEKIFIITGGGQINRTYNQAIKKITKPSNEDLDWIGIQCCRMNAELMRVVFGKLAYEKVVENPSSKIKTEKKIIIHSGGWKPGGSSDRVAVLIAKNNQVKKIVNLTNIDQVYTKDPRKFKGAQPLDKVSWKSYLDIVGRKWSPRLNTPFDPTASKIAQKNSMQVIIINGKKIINLNSFIKRKEFKGTLIY